MRLFFALVPPDDVRQQLAEVLSALPETAGRRIPVANLHLTLHFIGQCNDAERDCLLQAAKGVSFFPFELTLNCFGYFDRARVFWLGCQHKPATLQQLHTRLETALCPCGYASDGRPYTPHVSLLRKYTSQGPPPPTPSIVWRVDSFCLMASLNDGSGVRYDVVETFGLA